MIDAKETLFPLADVPKHVPPRRGGRKMHSSTAFRWAARGLGGIRLEVVQVGGTKMTNLEMLERFYARLAGKAVPARNEKTRDKAAARASENLAAKGW